MSHNISEEEIRRAVAEVMHPAINCSLLELGIVKEIEVKNGNVLITMAFPFPNVPIKDLLVNSVRGAIEGLAAAVEIKTVVMSREELQKFLALEKQNWKGGA